MTAEYARRRVSARTCWWKLPKSKATARHIPSYRPNDEFAGYGIAGWDLGNLTMQSAKEDPQDVCG